MALALIDLKSLTRRQMEALLRHTAQTWPELGEFLYGSNLDPDERTRRTQHHIEGLAVMIDLDLIGGAANPDQLKLKLVRG